MERHQPQQLQSDHCVREGVLGPIVLVVEDAAGAQCRLASILSRTFPNGSVIATACVSKSVDVLTAYPVDIAVIDLDLPDGSGIELVRKCFRLSPLTRCVITTTRDDEECLLRALAAGALGYLLKGQPEAVLIQQLRLLADGIPPLAPSIARRLVRHFTAQTATTLHSAPPHEPQDGLVGLSDRERQVLCLIAKGMQISEVARLLDIASNTVCSHIKSIYRKRNVSSRAEAALEAQRLGLV